MKIYGVYLGRFSPFHKGHEIVVDLLIKKHTVDSCLIMVGSTNSYTERTPYTFEERKEMIKKIYPDIKVIALPDIKPELLQFDGSTDDVWLTKIKEIEKEMDAKFIFYGGSQEDLKVLSQEFETEIIFDRSQNSGLSATNVREALTKNDLGKVKEMINPKIFSLVVEGYNKFHAKTN